MARASKFNTPEFFPRNESLPIPPNVSKEYFSAALGTGLFSAEVASKYKGLLPNDTPPIDDPRRVIEMMRSISDPDKLDSLFFVLKQAEEWQWHAVQEADLLYEKGLISDLLDVYEDYKSNGWWGEILLYLPTWNKYGVTVQRIIDDYLTAGKVLELSLYEKHVRSVGGKLPLKEMYEQSKANGNFIAIFSIYDQLKEKEVVNDLVEVYEVVKQSRALQPADLSRFIRAGVSADLIMRDLLERNRVVWILEMLTEFPNSKDLHLKEIAEEALRQNATEPLIKSIDILKKNGVDIEGEIVRELLSGHLYLGEVEVSYLKSRVSKDVLLGRLSRSRQWRPIIQDLPFFLKEGSTQDRVMVRRILSDWTSASSFDRNFAFTELLKHDLSFSGSVKTQLLRLSDFKTLLHCRGYFEQAGTPLDALQVFKALKEPHRHMHREDQLNLLLNEAAYFIDSGCEFSSDLVREMYGHVPSASIERLFLFQRYELIGLFDKYRCISVDDETVVNIIKLLEAEKQYKAAARFAKLVSVEYSQRQGAHHSVNNPFEKEPTINIRSDIALLTFYQQIQTRVQRATSAPDYFLREGDGVFKARTLFKKVDTRLLDQKQRVFDILRQHLLFISLNRLDRSRLREQDGIRLDVEYDDVSKSRDRERILGVLIESLARVSEGDVGQNWARIVRSACQLWYADAPSDVYTNPVLGLLHNGGNIFNRDERLNAQDDAITQRLLTLKSDFTGTLREYLFSCAELGVLSTEHLVEMTQIVRELKRVGVE